MKLPVEPRTHENSSFFIDGKGAIRVTFGPERVVGRIAGWNIQLDKNAHLLHGEHRLVRIWAKTDVLLADAGVRPHVILVSDRDDEFEFGHVEVDVYLNRAAGRKRWHPGQTGRDLDEMARRFVEIAMKRLPRDRVFVDVHIRSITIIITIYEEKDVELAVAAVAETFREMPALVHAIEGG